MKKLLLAGMLFFNLVVFAQTNPPEGTYSVNKGTPTTIDEYNYLTKGLKIQTENGLDTKKGYRLDAVYKREFNQYQISISNLVLVESSDVKAISVKAFSPVTKQTHYICIPVNNDELSVKHLEMISLFTLPLAQAYSAAIGDCLSRTTTKFMEYHKNSVK